MRDIVGTTIGGRYRVMEQIGEGGMSRVFKVWDNNMSVYLAMKLLRDDLAEDKIFLRRFMREAQTLQKLQHPHIVHFYRLEQQEDLVFILMDYVEGQTLRKELTRSDQPLTIERILKVMQAVCSALYYAHRNGMVHCDIKPANIMIHKNGTVMVSDFGIARQAEGATTATMAGAGTPAYMAPEQARGDDPTPQTDIYSLGIVLYEMLTGGERPFTGEGATITGTTAEKVRWEHMNVRAPSPRTFNSGVDEEMERIVMKCLEKDPGRRYASTMELMDDLQQALGGSDAPIEEKQASHQPAPQMPSVENRRPEIVKPALIDNKPPLGSGSAARRTGLPVGVIIGIAVSVIAIVVLSLSANGMKAGSLSGVSNTLAVEQAAAAEISQPTSYPVTSNPVLNNPVVPTAALDSSAEPVVTDGELKIAILAPLTGPVPDFGVSTQEGALLAIEEWNARGGVLGRKIVPIIEDSQCSSGPAVMAANKVIDQDKVHYIIGEVCSTASIPVSEIANANAVIQISPTSTNPGVTVDESGNVKPFIFRACFIDPFQGTAAAHFALDVLKAEKAYYYA